ncbi:hypothetical protein Thimo_1453 [Thioflavicoccus mobilis 8321]|uniref:Uncharacterized protein n=1 Tax=Thioflavicoccus mobilis 8321 TaxID=765912 RepID=L0GU03_9GAMM|nr:hypothetical protein Thimo_1453 [Thioflavicoccus mobilis 8321]
MTFMTDFERVPFTGVRPAGHCILTLSSRKDMPWRKV